MAATELFANNPSTTVSAGGTGAPASGTSETWTVASSAAFPAAATGLTKFHVSDPAQPSELIAVTNVSGTTWTVTRGAESSIPVAHIGGFTVYQVIPAGYLTGVQNNRLDWINAAGPGYLADPSGTNDSTTAIQNALNAATAGGVVYLPEGTYKTSSVLTIPTGVSLYGPSRSMGIPTGNYGIGGLPLQGAIIQPTGSVTAAVQFASNGSTQYGNQSLRNITIDGSNISSGTGHGILADAVAGVTLDCVTVYSALGDGLHANPVAGTGNHPPDFWSLLRCKFSNCGAWGATLNGLADTFVSDSEATGNRGSGGWNIINCNNIRFTGCKGEQNSAGFGWLLTANSGFTGIVHLLACTSQNNSQDGFKLTGTGTGTYQLIGCSSDGDGTGGTYSGLNVTSFSGIALADGWNTRVSAGAPAYGISMTSSNVLQAANANVAGGTAALNNGGSNSQFLVNSNFLCPPVSYAPGTLATLAVASLTFAAFDSTHVNTGSFAAPPSGSVLVTASFVTQQSTGTAANAYALAAHSTVTPLVGNAIQGSPANTTTNQPTVLYFPVSGLSPGTSYNFDLLGATGNASDALNILALGMTAATITSGNRGGPVVMTVQAV